MKVLIVGGNFANEQSLVKPSGVITKISNCFHEMRAFPRCIQTTTVNGGLMAELPKEISEDVAIWMPNITNEEEKQYPKKATGTILICSKVMRDGYTKMNAISRIFKMHGNAVIAITSELVEEKPHYHFELIDALGNVWCNTTEIPLLVAGIMSFVAFTKSAKRIRTTHKEDGFMLHRVSEYFLSNKDNIDKLLETNRKLQKHIMTSCGNRFFGNVSTRCQSLFPSARLYGTYMEGMFVSPRNSNKESIVSEDMVLYTKGDMYCGGAGKPSVDSPAQFRIYERMPNINFMIHGHALIDVPGALTTKEYKLCGDVNEVDEITSIIDLEVNSFYINLMGHGFLIGANNAGQLDRMVDNIINNGRVVITNQ